MKQIGWLLRKRNWLKTDGECYELGLYGCRVIWQWKKSYDDYFTQWRLFGHSVNSKENCLWNFVDIRMLLFNQLMSLIHPSMEGWGRRSSCIRSSVSAPYSVPYHTPEIFPRIQCLFASHHLHTITQVNTRQVRDLEYQGRFIRHSAKLSVWWPSMPHHACSVLVRTNRGFEAAHSSK